MDYYTVSKGTLNGSPFGSRIVGGEHSIHMTEGKMGEDLEHCKTFLVGTWLCPKQ